MSDDAPRLYIKNGEPVRACRKCGRRLLADRESGLCPACEDQELFVKVRDYIRANDVKDWQVAQEFDIPVAKVKRWIKEGRIQYKEEQSPREVIMANYCQICGKPTSFGTICSDCMREKQRAKKHGVAANPLLRDDDSKMRFIEEEQERRGR